MLCKVTHTAEHMYMYTWPESEATCKIATCMAHEATCKIATCMHILVDILYERSFVSKHTSYLIKVHPCDAGNPLLLRLSLLPKVLGHDTTDVGDLQHFLQLWCEGHTRVTHPPEMVVPLLVLLGRLRAGAACVRG